MHHPSESESGPVDTVAPELPSHDPQARVRFMCSFGGKILPRPHDNQLRYVAGDTRIVAVNRHGSTFASLLSKLSKVCGMSNVTIKYQLPSEDLDALISVSNDEDVENMMEEFDRLALSVGPKSARLRLFLFPVGGEISRTSSISSLLDGSTGRESWFFDALNGGGAAVGIARLERNQSEASSIVSEVPDYLFGLDHSDEVQQREPRFLRRSALGENVSVLDPGSPGPVAPSPYYSSSSAAHVPPMPDLPPVKTKPDNNSVALSSPPIEKRTDVQVENPDRPTSRGADNLTSKWQSDAHVAPPERQGPRGPTNLNPMWHYVPEPHYPNHGVPPMQVYYVPGPGPVPPANMPVQQLPIPAQYVQQFHPQASQIPVGYHHPVQGMGQVYGGGVGPTMVMDPYDPAARGAPADHGVNHQVYYGIQNPAGMVSMYQGKAFPVEELHGSGSDAKGGRVNQ